MTIDSILNVRPTSILKRIDIILNPPFSFLQRAYVKLRLVKSWRLSKIDLVLEKQQSMRATIIILLLIAFQQKSYSCSWSPVSFCETIQTYETSNINSVIVSGVVTQSDADGVDLEVIELLEGVETRTTLRVWDGTDFDCNGFHSMAAGDWLKLGDNVVIILPLIDSIENSWEKLGDYRMPFPWGSNPILRINDGLVEGFIQGNIFSEDLIWELPYNYLVNEFLGNGICNIVLPNLNVRFFHDENKNGSQDLDENNLPIGAISIPGLGQYENFKHSGIFFYMPEGPLTINFVDTFSDDWTIDEDDDNTFEIEVRPDGASVLKIGLIPTREFTYPAYSINGPNFRCGEEIPFLINVTNEGTVPTSGSFWLQMDARLETYVFEEEPDYVNEAEGIFGWDYEQLHAYESLTIALTITAPLITDPDQLSEIFILKMTDDINGPRDNFFCHEIELRCAFDPNDKQAFPVREDKLALISAPLTYTIRFQNTGNDYAKDVVITDTLDSNLDLTTFKLVSSSHLRDLTISSNDGYDKKFEFTNIFLPDSISDEPNSHGYITFTISAKEDISPDTQIDNTASIYFDFNPAIVTNTVNRTMVESFPTNYTKNIQVLDVQFYPNPAMDFITFNLELEEILIYDLSGRLIQSEAKVSQLPISHLDEGMYLMQISDGKQSTTKKMVVVR